jgi:hypothetical protein
MLGALAKEVRFSPLDPCCRFVTLGARLKTREFLLLKKITRTTEIPIFMNWNLNKELFFFEKKD